MQNQGQQRREIDDSEENRSDEAGQTWKERHGAAILAITSALVLAVVIAFQMNC